MKARTKYRMKESWAKYPNTIDSDKLEKVPHIVEDTDGNQIQIMASDPLNAIVLVTELLLEKTK